VLAVRASRPVLQSVPGEILGPAPMFLTSFITLSVFCLFSGGLFAAGSRLCADEARTSTASAASSVYLLEAAGSGLGGILASLILIRYFTSFEIAACVALLNLLAAAWVGVRTPIYRRVVLALILIAALLIPRAARLLEAKSLALLWHGFTLVESRNSIYGNLALVATSESRSLFENGLRVLTVPDPSAAEEAVHFALLEHTAPRSLLLIGGGINGSLAQALQYSSLEQLEVRCHYHQPARPLYRAIEPLLHSGVFHRSGGEAQPRRSPLFPGDIFGELHQRGTGRPLAMPAKDAARSVPPSGCHSGRDGALSCCESAWLAHSRSL